MPVSCFRYCLFCMHLDFNSTPRPFQLHKKVFSKRNIPSQPTQTNLNPTNQPTTQSTNQPIHKNNILQAFLAPSTPSAPSAPLLRGASTASTASTTTGSRHVGGLAAVGLATVAVAMTRRSRSGNTTAVRAEVPNDSRMRWGRWKLSKILPFTKLGGFGMFLGDF